MDAGWLKTYDQYYEQEVKLILNSVFERLQIEEKYTYTLGDIAFFRRYYMDLKTDAERLKIKQLIKDGRLEIVHGGLVSTDEATTNYSDIIRNFEDAHDFLKAEFGVKPRIAWQLDPFGHSAVNAALMAQMGMEAIFSARINEQDFEQRKQDRALQFIWSPQFYGAVPDSEPTRHANEIFMHVLISSYNPPKESWLSNKLYRDGDALTEQKAKSMVTNWLNHFQMQV